MMPFWLVMAWRESRAAWRHFVLFLACIALGVGAVAGVALFSADVERAVLKEARGLLGGDVEVRLSRRLGENGSSVLRSVAERGVVITHVSELVAMATKTSSESTEGPPSQLVELKAVEPAYPLYGKLRLEPDRPASELLQSIAEGCTQPCFGTLVHESLLIRLGLTVGGRLKIGQASFVVTGVVRTEPDRMANMFSLGPRVLISQEALQTTELVKTGSRVRERYLLKTAPPVQAQPLLYELRGKLASDSARVSSYRDAQPQLKQFLDQLARYLGLVGLTALFVGGIGVAMSIRAFLREKFHAIAILKTLGAESRTVIQAYLAQAVGLGLAGSLIGLILGVALQQVLPGALANLLDTELLGQVEYAPAMSSAAIGSLVKGVGLGVLATLLFSLWPLLTVREVNPAAIFRREVEAPYLSDTFSGGWFGRRWLQSVKDDPIPAGTASVIGSGLAALSMWQSGSWMVGLLFIAGLVVAVAALAVSAKGLVAAIKRLPTPGPLVLRQALGNLHRPGSQALGVMVAIGVGVMVIMTIGVIEHSLIHNINENRPADSPTFFFIDIQPDQTDRFSALVHAQTGELVPNLTPLVRARVRAIDGQAVRTEAGNEQEEQASQTREDKRKIWYLSREYALTFLEQLPKDNRIVQGAWWRSGEVPSRPFVSVEEEAARYMGLSIGSTVDLDIQGTSVVAEVASIRKVEWGNFSTNFYMILSPGSLDGAPMTYVGTVRVSPADEIPLQTKIVAALPNVTAINIGEVMATFARVLERLALAIRAVALFCIMAGALVMAAALTATRYQRLYDAVVLKALGATRALIVQAFAAEYALLGCVAGAVGIVLANGLAWATLRYVLDLTWSLEPSLLMVGLASTVLLTMAVGFLSTYRLLGQRPLTVLRQE